MGRATVTRPLTVVSDGDLDESEAGTDEAFPVDLEYVVNRDGAEVSDVAICVDDIAVLGPAVLLVGVGIRDTIGDFTRGLGAGRVNNEVDGLDVSREGFITIIRMCVDCRLTKQDRDVVERHETISPLFKGSVGADGRTGRRRN